MGTVGREKRKAKQRKGRGRKKEKKREEQDVSNSSLPAPIPEQHPPALSVPIQHSVLELGMLSLPVFVKICFSKNAESSHCS